MMQEMSRYHPTIVFSPCLSRSLPFFLNLAGARELLQSWGGDVSGVHGNPYPNNKNSSDLAHPLQKQTKIKIITFSSPKLGGRCPHSFQVGGGGGRFPHCSRFPRPCSFILRNSNFGIRSQKQVQSISYTVHI